MELLTAEEIKTIGQWSIAFQIFAVVLAVLLIGAAIAAYKWKVAWDDDNSYTKIYVNFPREEASEYTVKAKNAEITNEAGEPVSK